LEVEQRLIHHLLLEAILRPVGPLVSQQVVSLGEEEDPLLEGSNQQHKMSLEHNQETCLDRLQLLLLHQLLERLPICLERRHLRPLVPVYLEALRQSQHKLVEAAVRAWLLFSPPIDRMEPPTLFCTAYPPCNNMKINPLKNCVIKIMNKEIEEQRRRQ
jgi:hypothetical protein